MGASRPTTCTAARFFINAIVGTIGRETGDPVRLRVTLDTTGETLRNHVHRFMQAGSHLYTDENPSYNHVLRTHSTVCHTKDAYARDDADGIREVNCNSVEGMWADVRAFLRPFKGVHKRGRNFSGHSW